jgi:hypothetical protein
VGLRAGTVAANSTGSNGTSAFVFFVLAFTTGESSRKTDQPQRLYATQPQATEEEGGMQNEGIKHKRAS